jgi:S1-C subfamily serine protease
MRPAVVQIAVSSPTATRRSVIGTGFWVHGSGLAMTAQHVAEGAREVMENSSGSHLVLGQAMPNITGPITIRGSFNLLPAEILEEDERHDIALLRAQNNPFANPQVFLKTPETEILMPQRIADLSSSRVRDGQSIAVSGYPLAEPALVTTSGAIASAYGTDIQEAQIPGAPQGITLPNIADSYLADVAVNPGNSGGPVYRISDGQVIGICVAFRVGSGVVDGNAFSYNSGLSVIVPIQYGRDLLGKHIH